MHRMINQTPFLSDANLPHPNFWNLEALFSLCLEHFTVCWRFVQLSFASYNSDHMFSSKSYKKIKSSFKNYIIRLRALHSDNPPYTVLFNIPSPSKENFLSAMKGLNAKLLINLVNLKSIYKLVDSF